MSILKRDFMQITDRPVRDMLGDPLPGGGDRQQRLDRVFSSRLAQPTKVAPAEVKRVAYQIRDGDLQRIY